MAPPNEELPQKAGVRPKIEHQEHSQSWASKCEVDCSLPLFPIKRGTNILQTFIDFKYPSIQQHDALFQWGEHRFYAYRRLELNKQDCLLQLQLLRNILGPSSLPTIKKLLSICAQANMQAGTSYTKGDGAESSKSQSPFQSWGWLC